MTTWLTLFDSRQSGYLCLMLMHSLWQFALLAGVALVLERVGKHRRAEWAYGAYVAALAIGILLLPTTYVWIQRGETRALTPAAESAVVADISKTTVAPSSSLSAGNTSDTERAPTIPLRVGADWHRIAPWVVGVYVAGVIVMLARLLRGIVRVEQMRRRATPIVDGAFAEVCRRASRTWSLHLRPMLAHGSEIAVPQVVGLVRPVILIPTSLLTGLSTDELVMILLHELAHVRRHDMWINLLQRLTEVVLFFNPALWYLNRRIGSLREICCDELVCGQIADDVDAPRIGYANALLRIAELARVSPAMRLQLTALAADGRSPSELRRRVAKLLGEPLPEPVWLSRGGTVVLVVLAAAIVGGPMLWPSRAESATDTAQSNESSSDKKKDAKAAEDSAKDEKRGPVLEGRVTDEYGKPLPGVQVKLYSGIATRWLGQEAMTDAQGDYRFDPLETGAMMGRSGKSDPSWYTGMEFKHRIYVPADGRSWRDITVPMKKGHVEVFDMKMTRSGKIAGEVTDDQTEKPAADLDLRIHNGHANGKDGDFHVYAKTDDKGAFLSDALMPGKYVVEINDNNFRGKDRYPKIAEVMVESGRTAHVQAVTRELTQLQDPFRISGKAVGDDGKSMVYGGVGVRLKDGGKLRERGGGIDGRDVFGLIFGPVDRSKVSEESPYGVGTHDVELFGNNGRYGYELVSRTPSEPLRITDDPSKPELEGGVRYIRPNQPLEFQLVFKKVKKGMEEEKEGEGKNAPETK